ncbi:Hypothetical_protein [Hexamita inflata]|uniref:Hypothetical_protein n=1 Tax=Hexamita inflata TaxID=28002 RepID=A0AA86UZY5_9EUKA|nr:Hypothetical protein HINF_LOCUS41506 [Hexamita inflata]CAI9953863.1 Hypothetical protein HINF_LOCUS41508 [Hexamita inflata]
MQCKLIRDDYIHRQSQHKLLTSQTQKFIYSISLLYEDKECKIESSNSEQFNTLNPSAHTIQFHTSVLRPQISNWRKQISSIHSAMSYSSASNEDVVLTLRRDFDICLDINQIDVNSDVV